MLRDLIGLFLLGSGTVGLLGVLGAASPLAALGLVGVTLTVGSGTVLNISPQLPQSVRIVAGYCALSLGLWILVGLAVYLTPWSLLFAAVLAIGALLSSEGA